MQTNVTIRKGMYLLKISFTVYLQYVTVRNVSSHALK